MSFSQYSSNFSLLPSNTRATRVPFAFVVPHDIDDVDSSNIILSLLFTTATCQKESTDHSIHFGAPFSAASRRNRCPITSGSNSNYVGTVRRSQHQSEKINKNRSVNHFTVTSLSQELHENSARNKECRETSRELRSSAISVAIKPFARFRV